MQPLAKKDNRKERAEHRDQEHVEPGPRGAEKFNAAIIENVGEQTREDRDIGDRGDRCGVGLHAVAKPMFDERQRDIRNRCYGIGADVEALPADVRALSEKGGVEAPRDQAGDQEEVAGS